MHLGLVDGSEGPEADDAARDPLEAARLWVRSARGQERTLEGETAELVEEAIRTAQRAFDEIDTCNALLDDASDRGAATAEELRACLTTETSGPIPGLLDTLDALAAEVAASEATRRVATRILGQDLVGEAEEKHEPVPSLTLDDLPRVPSPYDSEQPGGRSLSDMWDAQDRTAGQRAGIHAERTGLVAKHLVEAVTRLAAVSLQDERFARETLAEARRAYGVWRTCVADRREDLG